MKIRRKPNVGGLFAALCVELWRWLQRGVGIVLLVAAFLAGMGVGAFFVVDGIQIEGHCHSTVTIDPYTGEMN